MATGLIDSSTTRTDLIPKMDTLPYKIPKPVTLDAPVTTADTTTSNTTGNPPVVPSSDVSTYDPTLSTVNLPTDTVSGQLTALLAKDSPYTTLARSQAADTANARGLLNSTMAAQSGEAAAINAALPIATSDATTFSTQRLANQTASNKAGEFNAGEKNKFGLQTQKQSGDIALQTLQGKQASDLQSEKSAQDTKRQTQAETAASDLATLNNNATSKLDITLQNSKNASAFDLASLDASVKAATSAGANVTSLTNASGDRIAKINAMPNLTDAQRDKMIADESTYLKNGIDTLTAAYTVPLGDYLKFKGPTAPTPVPEATPPVKDNAAVNNLLTDYVTTQNKAGTLSKEGVQQFMLDNKITQPMVDAAYPDPVAYNMIADYMGWTKKTVPTGTTTTSPTTTPPATTTPATTQPATTPPVSTAPVSTPEKANADAKASFTDYVTKQNQAGTLTPQGAKQWLAINNLDQNRIRAAYPDPEAYNKIASYLGWPTI